jgi:hypothetical protein
MLDLLYLAWNRLEFTRASLEALQANTDWSKVRKLWLYDDGSTDGTLELLNTVSVPCGVNLVQTSFRSPVATMNHFINNAKPELFAKIDNDVIVPPHWLGACRLVMEQNPAVDMLGIEAMYPSQLSETVEREVVPQHEVVPDNNCMQDYVARRAVLIHGEALRAGDRLSIDSPVRRNPRRLGHLCARRALTLETLDNNHRVGYCTMHNRTEVVDLRALSDSPQMETVIVPIGRECVLTDHIGGIGLMRGRAFEGQRMPRPNGRWGFTIWQKYHPEITKAWMNPSLAVILLNRLPMEPWCSLSAEYAANDWQRPWDVYTEADWPLWGWWNPALNAI